MFVTADQLVCHAVGDYILQSDWMAINKRKNPVAALVHVAVYTLPFVLCLGADGYQAIGILWSHFMIDWLGLARYVVWAKNFLAPPGNNPKWEVCKQTGYPANRPEWLTVWLLIIADNTMHVICNAAALKYL